MAIGIWDPCSDLCFRVLNLFEPKEINYDFFLERFQKERDLYNTYHSNKNKVEGVLQDGAKKARKQAQIVLKRVRSKVGF